MMGAPLVYLDSSCFGALVADLNIEQNAQADAAMRSLLFAFAGGQLFYLDSTWLRAEINKTEPIGKRRALLRAIPRNSKARLPLSAEVRKRGAYWEAEVGLSWQDALHVATAESGPASFLITFDKHFYELCRQNAKLLLPLKVLYLLSWLGEIRDASSNT